MRQRNLHREIEPTCGLSPSQRRNPRNTAIHKPKNHRANPDQTADPRGAKSEAPPKIDRAVLEPRESSISSNARINRFRQANCPPVSKPIIVAATYVRYLSKRLHRRLKV